MTYPIYNSGLAPNPVSFHHAMLTQSRAMLSICAPILYGREPDLMETHRNQQTFAEWWKQRGQHQKRHDNARDGGKPSPFEVARAIAAYEAREGTRYGAAAAAAREFGRSRADISKLQKTTEFWRALLEKMREYCLWVIKGGRDITSGQRRVARTILAECERLLDQFQP
jgi:hypothetical protein